MHAYAYSQAQPNNTICPASASLTVLSQRGDLVVVRGEEATGTDVVVEVLGEPTIAEQPTAPLMFACV